MESSKRTARPAPPSAIDPDSVAPAAGFYPSIKRGYLRMLGFKRPKVRSMPGASSPRLWNLQPQSRVTQFVIQDRFHPAQKFLMAKLSRYRDFLLGDIARAQSPALTARGPFYKVTHKHRLFFGKIPIHQSRPYNFQLRIVLCRQVSNERSFYSKPSLLSPREETE